MKSAALITLNSEAVEAGKSWVHLVPAGKFTGLDGRGPYDASDQEGIVLASRDAAGLRQLVIDYNHSTDLAAPRGEPAPAAGWVVGLQSRSDGVWGLVEWTPTALQHLANREYRYVSPVLRHSQAGRVTHLLRASLVNNPNLQLTSLFSEEEPMREDEFEGQLRQLLGLEATADRVAIVAGVKATVESAHAAAEPDPSKFVAIGLFEQAVKEANKLRDGVTEEAAKRRVDEEIRKGSILPFMRDFSVRLATSSLHQFEDFVARVAPGHAHLQRSFHMTGEPPDSAALPDDQERQIAGNLGLDPTKFAAFRATNRSGE